MDQAVAVHFELLHAAVGRHDGTVVKSTGDGLFATFRRPLGAVRAAADAQRALAAESFEVGRVRVRMGIHTGECIARGGDLYGRAVNKAARLEQAAYGGQVLLSDATAALVRGSLGQDLGLLPLGEHHFDGILDPTEVHQLTIAGLPNEHPPLPTRDLGVERLPLELTPLVGRDDALPPLMKQLRSSRVVTLVGPPGVGKSRLAVRLASEEARVRRSGVRFVDLTDCRQPEAALGTIANALGVRPDDEGGSFASSILRSLLSHDALVVLDNCEHLLDQVVPLVEQIVSTCPDVTVLGTSRERLQLPYEVVWPVKPLDLPSAEATSVAEVREVASVQLFAERVRSVSADYELDEADVPAVAEICRRCDGLPLALELAASRMGLLSPRELLASLESSFAVLDEAPAGATTAGRGLRQALDASYAALDDEVRTLFDRLAVFAGAASVVSIAEVCEESPDHVRAGLEDLARRSLVTVVRSGGWTRFRLLESVRQYALEHGLVGPELQARHARYFVEEAERRGEQYLTAEAHDAAREMAEHFADFRLAFRWLVEQGRPGDAARIVLGIHEFCVFSMRPELQTWAIELDGLLAPDDPLRAEVLGVIAIGAWFRGDHDEAMRRGEAALEAAATTLEPVSTIWARTALLNSWGHVGDLEKAAEHLYGLRKECHETGHQYWHVNALATEAVGLATVGLHDMALGPAMDAVRLAEELGNPEARFWASYAEALALRPRDLEGAAAALDRALAAARSNGSRFNEGLTLTEQLGVLVERGRLQAAAVTALDLLTHGERSGGFGRIWHTVVQVCQLLAQADRPDAAALLLEAVASRPVVPQADVVELMGALRERLSSQLGEATVAQLGTRAGFLSDAQVLERCRQELEALLRG